MKHSLLVILLIAGAGLGVQAMAQNPPQTPKPVPIFQVTVVARTIKAISYRHQGAMTSVEFRSTNLLPQAVGEAEVQSKEGAIQVNARFKRLRAAGIFGPEYITYVLWAISPEGRPVNLGEVLPDHDGDATLDVTCDLQAFGMIVTAEPHFAVTQPSDVVVLENTVTKETWGTVEEIDAKYELLKRGQYTLNVDPSQVTPLVVDKKTPLEIYEARNAIRIAKWAGAETYAPESLTKADSHLEAAENLNRRWGKRQDAISNAREAAQMAEDARQITVNRILAQEQEQDRKNAASAQAAAVQAQAQLKEVQAERDKAAQRAKLLQQLNAALDTRDSVRGLIISVSDVLFESGKYALKPEAREKLARVSGILLAYPGLKIEVDGYTDDIGSDQSNQMLSEERALAVSDYLTSQGVPAESIAVKGFGKANPIASNDTPEGRQQNRRVELVISGDAIESQVNTQTTAVTAASQ